MRVEMSKKKKRSSQVNSKIHAKIYIKREGFLHVEVVGCIVIIMIEYSKRNVLTGTGKAPCVK